MKTIAQIKALVEKAGGTLEEDAGTHDARILQAVAPEGKVWAGSDVQCMLIQWPVGGLPWTKSGRQEAFDDVAERVSFGLRDMTPEEIEEHAED